MAGLYAVSEGSLISQFYCSFCMAPYNDLSTKPSYALLCTDYPTLSQRPRIPLHVTNEAVRRAV